MIIGWHDRIRGQENGENEAEAEGGARRVAVGR